MTAIFVVFLVSWTIQCVTFAYVVGREHGAAERDSFHVDQKIKLYKDQ